MATFDDVATYHKVGADGNFLALLDFLDAEVCGAVVVGRLLGHAPPHVYDLCRTFEIHKKIYQVYKEKQRINQVS